MLEPSSEPSATVRPIRSEADYERALAEIDALFEAAPNTPEGDRLDVLATLVEAYEKRLYPILPPDPIDALLYYIESRGLTRRDLEPYLGSQERVAQILDRRRSLTIEMIRRLHEGLGLPAGGLIQPYALHRKSA
jgi:HTH-type transcriptional regulator/antitoxin HigA